MEAAAIERANKREAARAMLRHTYGVEAAFLRVPCLSKVLGLAQPTIYAAMREGRFFLPHRLLNSSPAVAVEDFLDWYCEPFSASSPAIARRAHARPRGANGGSAPRLDRGRASAIAQQVLREMGELDARAPKPRLP